MNQESLIGKRVVYVQRHERGNHDQTAELGTVTSENEHYVFVRFDGNKNSKACSPDDVRLWECDCHLWFGRSMCCPIHSTIY